LPRTTVFTGAEPTHLADAGLIRVSPGGWERKIPPESLPFYSIAPGAPRPVSRVTFLS